MALKVWERDLPKPKIALRNNLMYFLKTLPRALCLLPLLLPFRAAGQEAPSTAIEVFVDQASTPVAEQEITVPHDTTELGFAVKPKSLRVRYKLEGLDKDWRQRTDEMNFMVRFLNKNGDQILQVYFSTIGESAGWKGSVAKSDFISRRETVTVPAGAEYLSVAMSSSGPAEAVGIMAVTGIMVTSVDSDPKREFLVDSLVPGSKNLDWIKSGTHPSMATTFYPDGEGKGSPIFVITDDDVTAHADWATGLYALPKVVPGEKLEVRWQEAYSIGMGDPFRSNYERLPPGSYRFVVEDLAVSGTPLNTGATVTLEVPRPYWENPWFWLGGAVLAGGLATLVGRHLIRRRINRHLRNAQLIADERLRIARDLHDDLGTRLSHISLLGAHAESSSTDDEAKASFRQITDMSGELISALSQTVWMLNPKNNDLESLVDFLCRLVSELCRLKEIRCRIDAMSVTGNRPISHEFRHNFSLSVKETVNNALKHSKATEIGMKIHLEGPVLHITIKDNGIGICQARKGGSGLESIKQRMASIRGRCAIEEFENDGLQVSLEAPVS